MSPSSTCSVSSESAFFMSWPRNNNRCLLTGKVVCSCLVVASVSHGHTATHPQCTHVDQ